MTKPKSTRRRRVERTPPTVEITPPVTDLPAHLIAARPEMPSDGPEMPPHAPAPPRATPSAPQTRLGSYGVPSIDQHDALFLAATQAVQRKKSVRVDPRFMKAVMGVESGENGNYPVSTCRPSDGYPGPRSCGPMQIKWPFHEKRCQECDKNTVAGHIELATHIIGDTMKAHGLDEYGAYTKAYLTADDINGTTQAEAVRGLKRRVAKMEADAGADPGTTPPPAPPSAPPSTDPLSVIVGGVPYAYDYGWLADAGLNYYGYGINHGTTKSTQHTGIDVPRPCGSPLFSPAAGVVDCVGNQGTPRWGQACGAYADVDGGGVGNITILLDGGVKLTLGHCRQAVVKPGDRVTTGQKVGTVGSMNGCHVHVETSVERNGSYWLTEPVAALRSVMGVAPPADPRAGLVRHDAPGAPNGIYLPPDLPFQILLTPRGPNRPGGQMKPVGVTQHETGNTRTGTGAAMHSTWQDNGTQGHPDGKVGVHFYTDDKQIIQKIPLNETSIHSGDNRNQTHISHELAVNSDRDPARAERNAKYLDATLLRDVVGSTALASLYPHRTGSGCPAVINARGGWKQFERDVDALIGGSGGALSPPPAVKYPGLTIPVAVFEALFLDPALPADPQGTLTRWMAETGFFFPVHKLIRQGTVSYLVTGGGILKAEGGKVTVLK